MSKRKKEAKPSKTKTSKTKGKATKRWSAAKYGDAADRAKARGDHERAIEICLEGFAAHPGRFEFLHNAALRYEFDLHDSVGAERMYRKALEVEPDCEPSLCNLSGILVERGATAEAVEMLTSALSRLREEASLHYNLACALMRLGDSEHALEALAEAIRLEPEERRNEAKKDRDFKALRGDVRFKALLKEGAEIPPNPFPSYLARRLTTPPPPLAIADRFPELRALVRTTVRLHPRERGPLPARSSRVGGRFLSNDAKAWPRCPDHDAPCVGVLQLRCEDVPALELPAGKSAVQLLWCPRDHGDVDYAPKIVLRFLEPSEIRESQTDNPAVRGAEDQYVPRECAVFPEAVQEYPDSRELEYSDGPVGRPLVRKMDDDPELKRLMAQIEDEPGDYGDAREAYRRLLSTAPGTKLGGYPHWVQDPEYPSCPECSKRMDHYLTVASSEWGPDSASRWKPLESGPTQDEAGLTIGRGGSLYVFVCKRHPAWTVAQVSQS